MDKLREAEKLWKRTKLFSSAFPKISLSNDGCLSYTLCGEKTTDDMNRSLSILLNEGINFIGESFDFPVRKEDEQTVIETMAEKTPIFLVTLIEQGTDEFVNVVKKTAKTLQFTLDAASVCESDGKIKNWKGHVFDPKTGSWIKENGENIADAISIALWSSINN